MSSSTDPGWLFVCCETVYDPWDQDNQHLLWRGWCVCTLVLHVNQQELFHLSNPPEWLGGLTGVVFSHFLLWPPPHTAFLEEGTWTIIDTKKYLEAIPFLLDKQFWNWSCFWWCFRQQECIWDQTLYPWRKMYGNKREEASSFFVRRAEDLPLSLKSVGTYTWVWRLLQHAGIPSRRSRLN